MPDMFFLNCDLWGGGGNFVYFVTMFILLTFFMMAWVQWKLQPTCFTPGKHSLTALQIAVSKSDTTNDLNNLMGLWVWRFYCRKNFVPRICLNWPHGMLACFVLSNCYIPIWQHSEIKVSRGFAMKIFFSNVFTSMLSDLYTTKKFKNRFEIGSTL